MNKINTASVLAFERNLDVSDGFFWQTNRGQSARITPVEIREKSVRGTISNRLKKAIANDPAKLDAEIEKPNLQTVDVATLEEDNDTLVVRWTLKVLPFTGRPSVCNDMAYSARLNEVIQSYLSEHGLRELAHRYATNVANARWLWRNRLGAEAISVHVTGSVAGNLIKISFSDAKAIDLNSFGSSDENLARLVELILAGLEGKEFVMLHVEAKAVVGAGQEVFPSQELILDTSKKKSKVLYQINGKAGMHSQKIGNALRTIDTWHGADIDFPIAVEPYGSVTTLGSAFRQPKNNTDFYTLLDNWVLKGELPELDQQHYVIAVLVRGGVFGDSGKE